MIKTNIICDNCGTIKKESNHWFQVDDKKASFLVVWLDACQPSNSMKQLCSQACIHQALQQWIEGTK